MRKSATPSAERLFGTQESQCPHTPAHSTYPQLTQILCWLCCSRLRCQLAHCSVAARFLYSAGFGLTKIRPLLAAPFSTTLLLVANASITLGNKKILLLLIVCTCLAPIRGKNGCLLAKTCCGNASRGCNRQRRGVGKPGTSCSHYSKIFRPDAITTV